MTKPIILDNLAIRSERSRRRTVHLIVLFFLLLPVEGILRKWVLTDVQQILVFIRDPILIWIYLQYLGISKQGSRSWLQIWLAASIAFIFYELIQALASPLPFLVYLVGFRAYILYIPLAFIIGEVFREKDFGMFVRLCLWLSLPIALLVVAQFFSPVGSSINRGLSDYASDRFLVVQGIVRPYGPFTFTQAQSTLSIFFVGIVLIAWTAKNRFRIGNSHLIASSIATATMGSLSGSRTFFVGAAAVLTTYLLAALTTKVISKVAIRLIGAVSIVTGFLLIFVFVFPTSFAAMSQRQADAVRSEGSLSARIINMMTSAGDATAETPMLGHGAGAGSNMGSYLVNSGAKSWALGEYEWPRTIAELGPIVGVWFLLVRVWLFLWLLWTAFWANRISGHGEALVLFGVAGPLLLTGTITGQNQILSICWFCVGLTIALARESTLKARLHLHHAPTPVRRNWGVRPSRSL